MTNSAEPGCLICDFVSSAPAEATVYEDEHWFAGVLDSLEIPGWIVLAQRRHDFDPMGMTPDEAASFGPAVTTITAAMKDALEPERIYLLGYGENAQHWHVLLSTRNAEIPPEHRQAFFWAHREEYVDVAGAIDAAGLVRERLQVAAGASNPAPEEVS